MQDVTISLFTFLEAKRHLWNTYFMNSSINLIKCSELDDFEEIEKLLFSALVLRKIGESFSSNFIYGRDHFSYLSVIPREGIHRLSIATRITDDEGMHKWNKPEEIDVTDCQFNFISYFEWDKYGFATYPYYLVKINKCNNQTHFLGRLALIETLNAKVFYQSTETDLRGADTI